MRYITIQIAFILTAMMSSISMAESREIGLDRLDSNKMKFAEIKQKLTCYPTLISHWSNEVGFSDRVTIEYGRLKLIRTDVGEPDGFLTIIKNGKKSCEIELSLMPDIYYNSKDSLLLIYGFNGSNHFIEAFKISDECNYVGWAPLNSRKDIDEVKINWYNQSYGPNTCRK